MVQPQERWVTVWQVVCETELERDDKATVDEEEGDEDVPADFDTVLRVNDESLLFRPHHHHHLPLDPVMFD